ncbi:MAG: hypothetical protein C5B55_00440 [Blastocatellia bacterium]|nr:MAG: hypothetical protein C5B55_00440 [Blastocatellia bacterium]
MFLTGKRSMMLVVMFVVMCDVVVAQRKAREIAVEVFEVAGFPLNVQQAVLVKAEQGYLFRCQLSNSSDSEMIGLRYSLALEQPSETPRYVFNRSEAFQLKPYETKKITFQSPLRIIPKQGQRIVFMLEQAVSNDSIWEVAKAKEAFAAYLNGDYSVTPTVIRVANQVDAPIPTRIIYQR